MKFKQKVLSRRASWLLVSAGAALVAGRLAESGLERGYRAMKNDDPPEEPWKRGQSWPAALGWVAISAATAAAAQLAAKRGALVGLQKITGKRPPRSI
jgi:hypothetical protein